MGSAYTEGSYFFIPRIISSLSLIYKCFAQELHQSGVCSSLDYDQKVPDFHNHPRVVIWRAFLPD